MSRAAHDDIIGGDLADNYRAILADENRGYTTDRLVAEAEASNTPQLAAWARAEAAAGGADVTPTDATPAAEPSSDTDDSKPKSRRGRAPKKDATPPATEGAADAVVEDSLDDQLAPPAPVEEK